VSALRRFLRLTPGTAILGILVVGYPILWVLARPSGQPSGRYVGEVLGAEAVLLFSCALVLATLLPVIERAFDGLDRVAQWHRHAAVVGALMMIVHPTFAGSTPVPDATAVGRGLGSLAMVGLVVLSVWALAPSLRAVKWSRVIRRLAAISHERWLTGHRLIGLFVAAAVVHGAMVDPVLRQSATLKAVYLVIGGVGILAYLYRELLARYVVPIYDYVVEEVERPTETTLDAFLEPVGSSLTFEPGQFVFLAFGGTGGWQRHPFSVASASTDPRLQVSIRAVGDYTKELYDTLQPGTPVKAAGPFGAFDYRHGGDQQIWIAGGMGITPFLSWIRSLDDDFDRDVTFYYSVNHAAEAIGIDEINAAAADHPTLHAHLVDSSQDGFLTPDTVIEGVPSHAEAWVYMCGPPAMMDAMSKGFQHAGIARSRIRWEQFNIR